jgi:hypothetical protein
MARLPIRPPADPLDDIDRTEQASDALMRRQDRADDAGAGAGRDAPSSERGDAKNPSDEGDFEAVLDEAPEDLERVEHGVDQDDPIDEVERSGPDGGR